jgi:hypothetical protein
MLAFGGLFCVLIGLFGIASYRDYRLKSDILNPSEAKNELIKFNELYVKLDVLKPYKENIEVVNALEKLDFDYYENLFLARKLQFADYEPSKKEVKKILTILESQEKMPHKSTLLLAYLQYKYRTSGIGETDVLLIKKVADRDGFPEAFEKYFYMLENYYERDNKS